MTKKIFAISTLLLVLVVAFAFVYNFVFKKPSADQKNNGTAASKTTQSEGKLTDTNQPAKTPASTNDTSQKESSAIATVSDEPVFGATLSSDGKSIYYLLAGNGQLNQVSLDGKLDKVLSTEKYENIKKAIWNKQKNKIIIKTKLASEKTRYLTYDLATKKVSVLKENIDSAAWSNLGDKVIYKYYDPKKKRRTISVSDPDGKNWKDLAEFNYQNVEIAAVPDSSEISFWPSPDAFLSTAVGLVPFGGRDKREILRDRWGTDLLWSPNNSTALVSYADQKGGHKTDLAITNRDGNQFHSLVFPSFASKCVWSADSQFIYCALPGNIPDSAVLPNDWQSGKIQTADTFWKIEVGTGKKTRLVEAGNISGSYDVLSPFLSKDEKEFFFVNKTDGKLYGLAF
jgi:hypothetical protein